MGTVLVPAVRAQDPAQALEDSLTKIIQRAEPSVVSIARIRRVSTDPTIIPRNPLDFRRERDNFSQPLGPEHPDFQPNDFGAGIVISPPGSDERLVLTNYHVVRDGPVFPATKTDEGTTLAVRFTDRRGCEASIIAADPRSDLAALHLHLKEADLRPADLTPLDWSSSTPIRKGQLVVMLGNPHALARDGSASASWGMISNLTRRPLPRAEDRLSAVMLYRLGNLMQIDGRLNLGTSGGPVLNLKGELIGISTSLAAVDGYEKSAGFAIPLDDLTRRIVRTLVAGQEVEYGMLGVTPKDVLPEEFRSLRTGVRQASAAGAERVQVDSPAGQAGIAARDVVLRVAGEPVLSQYDLMRIVGLHAPESDVEVVIWRDRKLMTMKVKLGKWPVQDDEGIIETNPRFAPWRGLSVDYPTGRAKYSSDSEVPYRHAVVVTKVVENSEAHAAGLQPGNFISQVKGAPVQTPAEFHSALKSATGSVTLRLHEGRESRTVVVRE